MVYYQENTAYNFKSFRWDSNPRSIDYESIALPTEPRKPVEKSTICDYIFFFINLQEFFAIYYVKNQSQGNF